MFVPWILGSKRRASRFVQFIESTEVEVTDWSRQGLRENPVLTTATLSLGEHEDAKSISSIHRSATAIRITAFRFCPDLVSILHLSLFPSAGRCVLELH